MQILIDEAAEHFVPVLITGGILIALALRALTTIITTTSHERSRREIAAYIAEGTIPPDQGERLIRANVSQGQRPS